MKEIDVPLVKIPEDVENTLFLIREELKIRQLFALFEEIGMSDCAYRPNLTNLILKLLKLENIGDETFRRYEAILERRCRKFYGDPEKLARQTMKAYQDLVALQKHVADRLKTSV